ncbi:MAG: hypothetical protein AAB691_04125 [Patescibacteria group bacterium]
MNHKNILFVITTVALIGGVMYMVSKKQSIVPDGDIACTEEALICPDGSGVGRGGQECKFAACPQQASLIGILKQDTNGFMLVVNGSSGVETMERTYTLPLKGKVSNVLDQLVNQKVRAYGSFIEGTTYSVDRIEELPSDLGEVGVGKTVFINGVWITLNKIVQDNRCPTDRNIQCDKAGWVTVNVTLQSGTNKETRDIASNGFSVAFDSYQISIVDTKPSRISTEPVPKDSYLITFRVKSNK